MKFLANQPIILASESPRRKELLQKLGIPFQTMKSNVVENVESTPSSVNRYVTELAIEKAKAIAKHHVEKAVIGADTIVSFNGKVFPKPKDKEQAKQFLQTLSGQTHLVITAVAIMYAGEAHSFFSETKVTFYELDDAMIDAYIETGDCFDKAGAYGIQSGGLLFVQALSGDYYSVMGLPVAQLSRVLQDIGAITLKRSVKDE
ncbi:nucleoside triphosphate pyrophosphatase [Sporosarcina pasteurii]|uniref:dTTP/UTP pyrophosphatase n=1 Tax=Sporosarcina pasteurii TaxID=1474 RepID=A0A380BV57_SPOPA|nr:Maf family protein [Sporosarcina pasteurii]MDS9471329.1 Maf family protein [Sporosarcina pasteurii]QBQ05043.1 septum formation protein Maf [Sporosarcina pasteurii]SUJ07714.1 Septum formation protein Maf [Sporosarcina pasteurii]